MNGTLKRIVVLVTTFTLIMVPCMTCFAQDMERDDAVIAGQMAGDALVARPLGLCATVIGSALFVVSLLFAPARGIAAAMLRHWRFERRVHLRQGLLSLARSEPIHDRFTLNTLRRADLIRPDGVATDRGRAQAAKAQRDEHRWEVARRIHKDTSLTGRYDGLTPIETVFTADEIDEFDRQIGSPRIVPAAGGGAQ